MLEAISTSSVCFFLEIAVSSEEQERTINSKMKIEIINFNFINIFYQIKGFKLKEIYKVSGMTCQGCADNIQEALSSQAFTVSAEVDLESKKLYLETSKNTSLNEINSLIIKIGNYKIINNNSGFISNIIEYFTSKKTLLIALSVVLFSSLSIQISAEDFLLDNWMISYMGMFFLIFSFLKLIDVRGFSITFSKYDLISKVVPGFAITYPFLELILALSFLSKSFLFTAYLLTLIFMISQFVGVFISLQRKEIIRCACMGSSINLDISYLTLFENLIMIVMSSYMLIVLM